MQTIIIYHSKDPDGWYSAYLLGKIYTTDTVFFKYNYEEKSEWMDFVEKTIKNNNDFKIIFADVTPPIDWLSANLDIVDKIEIYDHHKSKFEDINCLLLVNYKQNLQYNYNSEISGCAIIFQKLFNFPIKNYLNLSVLVQLISLYDTWKFENHIFKQNILAVNEYLFSCKYKLTNLSEIKIFFDDILADFDNALSYIVTEGNVLIANNQIKNYEIIENGFLLRNIFFHTEKNNYHLSDLIYEKIPDAIYIISYTLNQDNEITLSIRSKTEDCSVLAKKIYKNGGGHYGAAGVNLPLNDFIKFLLSYGKHIS